MRSPLPPANADFVVKTLRPKAKGVSRRARHLKTGLALFSGQVDNDLLDLAELALQFLHFGLECSKLALHHDQLVPVGPDDSNCQQMDKRGGCVRMHLSASSFFGLPRFLGGPFSPLAGGETGQQ